MQRDAVEQIIAHLRRHGEAEGTWSLAPRGGWLFEPLQLFATSAERTAILEAMKLA